MIALLCFFLTVLVSPFKSKSRLEAENVALRRQLIILRRKVRGRVHLSNGDRLFLVQLYRWFPSVLNTITIIRPETVVRWHRPASAGITVLAGTDGCTTITLGTTIGPATGAMSRMKLTLIMKTITDLQD